MLQERRPVVWDLATIALILLLVVQFGGIAFPSVALTIDTSWDAGAQHHDLLRTPTRDETPQAWRNRHPKRYFEIEADFDGDGLKETAGLRIRTSTRHVILIVSSTSHGARLAELSRDLLSELGIRIVSPGVYKTACGKGHWECGPDEPETLKLEKPAIELFEYQGSKTYFHWDSETESYLETKIDP